jgi:hypothetical protein
MSVMACSVQSVAISIGPLLSLAAGCCSMLGAGRTCYPTNNKLVQLTPLLGCSIDQIWKNKLARARFHLLGERWTFFTRCAAATKPDKEEMRPGSQFQLSAARRLQ